MCYVIQIQLQPCNTNCRIYVDCTIMFSSQDDTIPAHLLSTLTNTEHNKIWFFYFKYYEFWRPSIKNNETIYNLYFSMEIFIDTFN